MHWPKKNLQLRKIFNKLYLWVNFTAYFPVSKVMIRWILQLNFEPEDIKVSELALDEMVWTRIESLFF